MKKAAAWILVVLAVAAFEFVPVILRSFPSHTSARYAVDKEMRKSDVPVLSSHVYDGAGWFSDGQRAYLEEKLSALETEKGLQIAAVTVKDLQGRTIEETALEIGRKNGVGEAGADNGIVILASAAEREVRIEVGYGLEGVVPDLLCGRIIREQMIPHFQKGQYAEGFDNAVTALASAAGAEDVSGGQLPPDTSSVSDWKPFRIIKLVLLLILYLLLSGAGFIYRGRGRSGGFFGGGGSFGGGGFFGGGGSFGGGGASGRW